MTVSANAHVKTLTNAGDPLILQDGTPLAGVKITFQLVTFGSKNGTSVLDAEGGETIANKATSVTTDTNGEFTTQLWPNNRGDSATAYRVTFSKLVKEFFILVQEGLDDSLISAKTAYSVGTGAVNVDSLVGLLAGYAPLSRITALESAVLPSSLNMLLLNVFTGTFTDLHVCTLDASGITTNGSISATHTSTGKYTLVVGTSYGYYCNIVGKAVILDGGGSIVANVIVFGNEYRLEIETSVAGVLTNMAFGIAFRYSYNGD